MLIERFMDGTPGGLSLPPKNAAKLLRMGRDLSSSERHVKRLYGLSSGMRNLQKTGAEKMLKTHLIGNDGTVCQIQILHYINDGMWRTHPKERAQAVSGFTIKDLQKPSDRTAHLSAESRELIDCLKCRKIMGWK